MDPEIISTDEHSTSPEHEARDSPTSALPDHPVEIPGQFVTLLEARLEDSQLRTEQGEFFIPNGTLEKILDQNTVCLAIQDSLPTLGPNEAADYARVVRGRGCFPNAEKSFCKIFATLVLSGMNSSIRSFVDLGLNDSYLPMPDPRLASSSSSPDNTEKNATEHHSLWESLWKTWSRSHLRIFFMSQWSVLAPVFNSVDRVNHFSFSQNYILPFIRKESPTPSDLNSDFDSLHLGQARYGGYSEVRRIKIHPDHYNFGDYGVDNPNHLFALKRLHTREKYELQQEAGVLKRFRNATHTIQLLATFEVHENTFGDPLTRYYMIFPWAAGDLESLWKDKQSSVGDSNIAPWIAQQCYEVARAVSTIHQDAHDHDISDAGRVYGRHGDIKPGNILWFPRTTDDPNRNLGELVLGDFGLADFHGTESRSNEDPRNVARSPKYRAPEFDIEMKISRKIDVWMLGCTFLEFVIWFVMGLDAVFEKFPKDRLERDINGIYADIFFRVVNIEGQRVGSVIKPQVTKWIASLHGHEHCSDFIHDFLGLVERHMLVADPNGRLSASELADKLEGLWKRCQVDAAYYEMGQPWVDKKVSEEGGKRTHDGKTGQLERLLKGLRFEKKVKKNT